MEFETYAIAAGFDPAALTDSQRSALLSGWKAEVGNLATAAAQNDIEAVADEYRQRHASYPHALKRIEAAAERARAEGWDRQRAELEFVRASRPDGSFTVASAPNLNLTGNVQEAALLLGLGQPADVVAKHYGERVTDRATAPDVRSVTLHGLMRETMRAAGMRPPVGRFTDSTIRAAFEANARLDVRAGDGGISTYGPSFSSVLTGVTNKLLLQSWTDTAVTWRKWCRVGEDLNDFKAATRYRVTALGSLKTVPPGGELNHVQLDAETYSQQLATKGAMFGLDRQAMINDDLSVVSTIPRQFGRMAAIAVEKAVYTALLQNASTIFTSGRKNLATGAGSVLADAGLAAAWQKAREATDLNGDPILATPSVLLAPPALETTADKLNQSTATVGTSTTDKPLPAGNPWAGKFDVVVSAYMGVAGAPTGTTGSDTQWFLLMGPGDFAVLEVAFLAGQQSPHVEQAQLDFSVLGMQWRCYLDFGVGLLEYRGNVRSAGA